MVADKRIRFEPDYTVAPGATLQETLDEIGMSQAELAVRTNRPKKTINEIIKGKAAITPETAIQLEHVLGIPDRMWNNLERNYRERIAHQEEQDRLEADVQWLGYFPFKTLIAHSFIKQNTSKRETLAEVLNFYGVASPSAWEQYWSSIHAQSAYRKSKAFQSNPGAVSAWLRIGEIQANRIECGSYDVSRFREALKEVRELTRQDPEVSQPKLERLCAESGVAVVFFPELPKTRISGSTRWLSSKKALMQLSLRYKTDDHLWFTFFHEAAHIILHKKSELFIEENDSDGNETEQEADAFASNFLIPKKDLKEFVEKGIFTELPVRDFAAHIGVSPSIVVGRLQHDEIIPYSRLNNLKKRLKFSK